MPTPDPSATCGADTDATTRAVLRALRMASRNDIRATADPATAHGVEELASLYRDQTDAAWREVNHANEIRTISTDTVDTAPLPAQFAVVLVTATTWANELIAAAVHRSGHPLPRIDAIRPALIACLAYLIAHDGEGSLHIHDECLWTVTAIAGEQRP